MTIARKLMPYILVLSFFTPNYVCAADNQDNENAAYTTPQYRYPNIIDHVYEFEDKTSIDDLVGMRTFSIPADRTEPLELTVAYQSYFQGRDDRTKIATLVDYDAAFTAIFKTRIGSSRSWQTIEVLVGEFAQDYCGANIDIVYFLNNSEVSSVFIDNSARDLILSDSKCPKIPGYLEDGTEPPPVGIDLGKAFTHFCDERASCLAEYLKKPANIKKLKSTFTNVVRELQIK